MIPTNGEILLTGATGFVGGRLWPALQRQSRPIRCMSRDPVAARQRWPEREWVKGDLSVPEQLPAALQGCAAAFYLVHGMAEGHPDLLRREVASARAFREAAAQAGVRRIIYLGGVAPASWSDRHQRLPGSGPSEHLASRLEVGEVLRAGPVPTIELRASMIIGHGSLSWQIVRDLSARLPGMVLPRWLRSLTQPVAIDDVILALTRCLELPDGESQCFDIPGPEALSGSEILQRTAQVLGLRPPLMIPFPFLSPRISSLWLRLVTRADWAVAREIVIGLKEDLLAEDGRFWSLIDHQRLVAFDEAARRALAEEKQTGAAAAGFWGRVEEWVTRVRGVQAARA